MGASLWREYYGGELPDCFTFSARWQPRKILPEEAEKYEADFGVKPLPHHVMTKEQLRAEERKSARSKRRRRRRRRRRSPAASARRRPKSLRERRPCKHSARRRIRHAIRGGRRADGGEGGAPC